MNTFPAGHSIRVAVVGAGTMGLDHITRLTRTIPGAHVSAVVEPNEARGSEALASTAGSAAWFPDLEAMIDADAADAVLVASPGAFHEQALHRTLDAGLPTLCEKPLTLDATAARRVVDHEIAFGAPLIQVGFHRRYDAGYLALRNLITSRDAGELLALHCRHRNPVLPTGWNDDLLIEDAAAHEMDIVSWLADEPIVSVEVHHAKRNSLTPNGVRDPLLILLRTESGVLADVEINMNVQAAYQVTTEAVLERGTAEVGKAQGQLRLQDGRAFINEHQSYVTRFADAYDREINAWVTATRSGTRTGATTWDGYRAVLLCEAGIQAQRTGIRVQVDTEETPEIYRSSIETTVAV